MGISTQCITPYLENENVYDSVVESLNIILDNSRIIKNNKWDYAVQLRIWMDDLLHNNTCHRCLPMYTHCYAVPLRYWRNDLLCIFSAIDPEPKYTN